MNLSSCQARGNYGMRAPFGPGRVQSKRHSCGMRQMAWVGAYLRQRTAICVRRGAATPACVSRACTKASCLSCPYSTRLSVSFWPRRAEGGSVQATPSANSSARSWCHILPSWRRSSLPTTACEPAPSERSSASTCAPWRSTQLMHTAVALRATFSNVRFRWRASSGTPPFSSPRTRSRRAPTRRATCSRFTALRSPWASTRREEQWAPGRASARAPLRWSSC
mmetsp:Transcript_4088/g.13717  ORF Transcript_4088/g.13717 Transcript_4088/m.13717 type:complete len:223 (+) Transcript_4088:538-1206(+)